MLDAISTVSTDTISVFYYPKSHISLQVSAVLFRLGVLYNAFVDVLSSTDLLDFGMREGRSEVLRSRKSSALLFSGLSHLACISSERCDRYSVRLTIEHPS